MADRLVVIERDYIFVIQWELDDGDDLGAILGDSSEDGRGVAPADRGDWEHWAACKALLDMGVERRNGKSGVFFFETQSEANKALKAVKLALKQDRPLPEWAKTAIGEGWKPPKGWKA